MGYFINICEMIFKALGHDHYLYFSADSHIKNKYSSAWGFIYMPYDYVMIHWHLNSYLKILENLMLVISH